MLEAIRLDQRMSHNALDADILDNIEAALSDLERVGINARAISDDPLIVKAVKLYCREQYNTDGQAERYGAAYASLRDALALSGDYGK